MPKFSRAIFRELRDSKFANIMGHESWPVIFTHEYSLFSK